MEPPRKRKHLDIGAAARSLWDVARLPGPEDNVVIARDTLPEGTLLELEEDGRLHSLTIETTVLEGHRFAHRPVLCGEPLLSWGLPFGVATRDVAPGQWLCNAAILKALRDRKDVTWPLPAEHNFVDKSNTQRYRIDDTRWRPGKQVEREHTDRTFPGFLRPAGRGVGTRNYIVVVGLTSLSSGFATAVAEHLQTDAAAFGTVDGVAAVAHTEGETLHAHNRPLLLRTLAGLLVHPNVGAALVVATGTERHLSPAALQAYLAEHRYPVAGLPLEFFTASGDFVADLQSCATILRSWLPTVARFERSPQPLSALSIALQCGGSDAFSGVSGNPLQGWVAQELVKYGGKANLAETPELVGAEAYIMDNVRDRATAETFIDTVERYKDYAARHGQSAEGNPSGGNFYRGLYNITLKSLGAALKKPREVCLDYVVQYGERMAEPGYYFMDSPGNDLESVAGQVACGCNVVFFTTGNGSITNFPFVPTVKVVTTTRRFEFLRKDMDVNAGEFSDGTSTMEELGARTFEYMLRVAAGERTAGEKAGHAQVQIWRDWMVDVGEAPPPALAVSSHAIPTKAAPALPALDWTIPPAGVAVPVALVLPTSLCSSQVARLIVEGLGREAAAAAAAGRPTAVRYVTLPHTEGCGYAAEGVQDVYGATLVGHLTHPSVVAAVLLEHGCEKTHNDYWRHALEKRGLDPGCYGWASVQADGGIDATKVVVRSLLQKQLAGLPTAIPPRPPADPALPLAGVALSLGAAGPVASTVGVALAHAALALVGQGAQVLLAQASSLLECPAFLTELLLEEVPGAVLAPTLRFGERPAAGAGLHLMQTFNDCPAEVNAGLVAAGAVLQLTFCSAGHQVQSNPLAPTLYVAEEGAGRNAALFDVVLPHTALPDRWPGLVLERLLEALRGAYQPISCRLGNAGFQIPRATACSM